MAIDIAYNENLQTEWGGSGDIKLVTGIDQIEQAISTSIIERVGRFIPSMTPTKLEEVRGRIEQAVEQNTFSEPPIDVWVDEIDREERKVTFGIKTNRVTLTETLVGE